MKNKKITLTTAAGDYIDSVIAKAIETSISEHVDVTFKFNDIDMDILFKRCYNRPSAQEEYQLEFKQKCDIQQKLWLESPEGQEYKQSQVNKKIACQKAIDKAMFDATKINWSNPKDILRWCNIIFENWIVGVNVPQEEILFIFAERGNGEHYPNQYCKENYSEDKKAEWIIGQFLAGVKGGAIPYIFAKFYEEVVH